MWPGEIPALRHIRQCTHRGPVSTDTSAWRPESTGSSPGDDRRCNRRLSFPILAATLKISLSWRTERLEASPAHSRRFADCCCAADGRMHPARYTVQPSEPGAKVQYRIGECDRDNDCERAETRTTPGKRAWLACSCPARERRVGT